MPIDDTGGGVDSVSLDEDECQGCACGLGERYCSRMHLIVELFASLNASVGIAIFVIGEDYFIDQTEHLRLSI